MLQRIAQKNIKTHCSNYLKYKSQIVFINFYEFLSIFLFITLVIILYESVLAERGDGWYFGGISKNGMWTYADGDSMKYQAFGAMPLRDTIVAARTFVLYGAIFQSSLAWGYLYPYSNNVMGYICEAQYCWFLEKYFLEWKQN